MIVKRKFDASEEIVVSKLELLRFAVACLRRAGCEENAARTLADCLIASDYRGHYSHGLNRLHVYVQDIATGAALSRGEPTVERRRGATAVVDGCNLLGPVVGNFSMQLAIDLAREYGVGWVVARRSNHFGMAAAYALQALEHGFIGMAFTNTSPCVFPTRSAEKSLGSNPICVAAPGNRDDDHFCLDMASTTVAYGKIEVASKRGARQVPDTWGADEQGSPTSRPDVILADGGLLPLGGSSTVDGGHKGSGLCMMVEILCGILAGSAFGKNVRRWMSTDEPADLGQCFVAIDPSFFTPGFEGRMQELIDETRTLKPRDPSEPVLVAGDPERAHAAMCDSLDGIVYKKTQLEPLARLGEQLGVPMFETKKAVPMIEDPDSKVVII